MTAPHPGLPPVSESTGIILKMGPYPWGLAKEPALKTYPRRFLAIGTTSQWVPPRSYTASGSQLPGLCFFYFHLLFYYVSLSQSSGPKQE